VCVFCVCVFMCVGAYVCVCNVCEYDSPGEAARTYDFAAIEYMVRCVCVLCVSVYVCRCMCV
jgi:hypothetical protein